MLFLVVSVVAFVGKLVLITGAGLLLIRAWRK